MFIDEEIKVQTQGHTVAKLGFALRALHPALCGPASACKRGEKLSTSSSSVAAVSCRSTQWHFQMSSVCVAEQSVSQGQAIPPTPDTNTEERVPCRVGTRLCVCLGWRILVLMKMLRGLV